MRMIIAFAALVFIVSSAGCTGILERTVEIAAESLGLLPKAETSSSDNAGTPDESSLPQRIQHKNIRFSDMTYERPDIDSLESRLEQLYNRVLSGTDGDELALFDEYQEIIRLYDHADSMLSLAYLLYAFNVHEPYYNEEYQYLEEKLLLLDLTLTDLSIALFDKNENVKKLAEEYYGSSFIHTVYEGDHLNSEEIQEDLSKEEQLIHEYDKLASSYTINYGGNDLTVEELIENETIPIEIKQDLYNRYFANFNREAGSIFLELVKVRTTISKKLGYQSYADYQYENYGRDYSTDDAKNLQSAIKKYIVPIYIQSIVSQMFEEDAAYTDYLSMKIDQKYFEQWFSSVSERFSPLLSEALHYMMKNELFDSTVDSNKMEGSFTTYLSDYQTPFMFTQWTADPSCASTFIHETGHFANYYWNAQVGWSRGSNLDLAEIDSQSLPLLMIPEYKNLFGKYASIAEREVLNDAMYAIISGCMEDEFQQAVYKNPEMSLEEMNEIYLQICEDYGFELLYGYTGVEWAAIPHTFQSPLYYISYAASMIPALEIWELSTRDYQRAKEVYFSIMMRDNNLTFRQILSQNGLKDIFVETTIKKLAETLKEHM